MPILDGSIHPDFGAVAAELKRQLPRHAPGGAALCIHHEGRPVVDIWGGTRDRDGNPWTRETTAPSFSTTKGVVSTLLHVLVDRGLADYDDPVAKYWPEFAAEGKGDVTIRRVLCHEAGLYRIADMIERPREMLDWDHMCARIAAARPVHAPGEAHGYHGLTYGWLAGGLIERIAGAPLEDVLRRELVEPLGLDGCFIGMPPSEQHRRALLVHEDGLSRPMPAPSGLKRLWARFLRTLGMEPEEFRAALMPFDEPIDWNAPETVAAKIPAANGQFTARSLARMYAVLAEGGSLGDVRLLSPERVERMGVVQNRTRDRVLLMRLHWRLGYHRVFALTQRAPHGFGHFGYGGSGAWCDPSRRLAVALTLNSGVGTALGDLRIARLNRIVIKVVDELRA